MSAPPLFFVVAGERRFVRPEVWDRLIGPKPSDDWTGCDGCTASPDSLAGYAIWPACRIHDWHWCEDGPGIPHVLSNLILRINVWRCLRAQGCPWWQAVPIAAAYWLGVTAGGWVAWRAR